MISHRMTLHYSNSVFSGLLAGFLALVPAYASEPALAAGPGEVDRFERDVLPIFQKRCLKCHGSETRKQDLDLRTPADVLKGSSEGPVVVAGNSHESLLLELVSEQTMPPGKDEKLSEAEVATIRVWIDSLKETEAPAAAARNAPVVTEADRQFWAFRALRHTEPPSVSNAERVSTPIDAFVWERLETKGLDVAPDAAPIARVRRAYFDLLGLPPSPEEVDAFVADERPDAYERLIDRLLASPHYGERWARHWLDVVGYVDTAGTDNDAGIIRVREGGWRYRDYVVRALNTDKPYDRFLTEQVAGDELAGWRNASDFTPEIQDLLIATGFLRTACDNTTENELNRPLERYQVLHGTIENVTSSLLGLTVACARCHDHKFDAIPQRDYYRLMALFTPSYNPAAWIQPQNHYLPDVSLARQKEIDRGNAEIDRQVAELNKQLAELRKPYEEKLVDAKLAQIPETIRADTKAALATPADKRSDIQKYLVDKLGPQLKLTAEEVAKSLSDADRARAEAIPGQVAALNARKQSYGKIQALYEDDSPPLTRLLKRGNHETPGPVVSPGFLSALCDSPLQANVDLPTPGARSSGRRTALARWLTAPGTPAASLAARVMVNRVWQHHFGTGLVATPENFGRAGTPPTHHELLEWLAADFIEGGWHLKRLHRLIMTSTVYRQASHRAEPESRSAESIDPANQLLWKMPLRRLEAEVIRDSVLAASGDLDGAIGGPPIPIEARPDGMVVIDEKQLPTPTARWRRSMYLLARRNYGPTMLTVFDAPVMASNCPRRSNSVVPLQALTMINSAFVWDQAQHFASRVIRSAPAGDRERIALAFRLALARPPSDAEAARSAELLERQVRSALRLDPKRNPALVEHEALSHLCLMLLNANEFLYLE